MDFSTTLIARALGLLAAAPLAVAGAPIEVPAAFALCGHAYPLLERPQDFERLLDALAAEDVAEVFFLGDCGLEQAAVVETIRARLGERARFLPGNHELHGEGRAAFAELVGPDPWTLDSGGVRFVGIHSSRPVEELRTFVAASVAEHSGPWVLLAHHRVWDDTLIDPEPYGHDKSFRFEELLPALQPAPEAIFAGNSRRQYFRDRRTSPLYGNQNLNNVYWCDLVADIPCYSVGMGDGRPKAGYVVAVRSESGWRIEPRVVLLEGTDPPPVEWVDAPRHNPFHSAASERAVTRALWWKLGGLAGAAGAALGLFVGLGLGARRRARA